MLTLSLLVIPPDTRGVGLQLKHHRAKDIKKWGDKELWPYSLLLNHLCLKHSQIKFPLDCEPWIPLLPKLTWDGQQILLQERVKQYSGWIRASPLLGTRKAWKCYIYVYLLVFDKTPSINEMICKCSLNWPKSWNWAGEINNPSPPNPRGSSPPLLKYNNNL